MRPTTALGATGRTWGSTELFFDFLTFDEFYATLDTRNSKGETLTRTARFPLVTSDVPTWVPEGLKIAISGKY